MGRHHVVGYPDIDLVAKELVPAQDDDGGVLLLGQFTMAARDLPKAGIVNPYEARQARDVIVTASPMPKQKPRERWCAVRGFMTAFNVDCWAGHMLADAAELRWEERRLGRFTHGTRFARVSGT